MTPRFNRRGVILLALLVAACAGAIVSVAADLRGHADPASSDSAAAACRRHDDSVRASFDGGAICG
jgi:hypothetical protein